MSKASGEKEIALQGPGAGSGTVRVGDTVRRQKTEATPSMLFVLEHLERLGFEGCPRVLGEDNQDRIVLTYIEGAVALKPYPAWASSDTTLISVANLLRALHDTLKAVTVPSDIRWPRKPSPEFSGNQICHMDVSLSNVVNNEQGGLALIDFEELGLAQRVWDVARTARHWVPIIDPGDLTKEQLFLAPRLAERLALFAKAYGLDAHEKDVLVEAILSNADASFERMREYSLKGHPGYSREWKGGARKRNRRAKEWVRVHREELEAALNSED